MISKIAMSLLILCPSAYAAKEDLEREVKNLNEKLQETRKQHKSEIIKQNLDMQKALWDFHKQGNQYVESIRQMHNEKFAEAERLKQQLRARQGEVIDLKLKNDRLQRQLNKLREEKQAQPTVEANLARQVLTLQEELVKQQVRIDDLMRDRNGFREENRRLY